MSQWLETTVSKHGPIGPRPRASVIKRTSSRSRLSLNEVMIRIISTVKCYFRLHSLKNWEFRTIGQLATCDDSRPYRPKLLPYTIITNSVKKVVIGRADLCDCKS
ncbi:hypothetical protein TNCV_2183981 [Trichonephila clavipes]|nr:hypothetical protein TNCV_2183981 [Trichonephila clavipes]